MSLVQTYLDNNGYDYYGNAAEDTLVFFVRDEDAPSAEEVDSRSNGVITNLSENKRTSTFIDLTAKAWSTNKETHAEV